MGNKAPLGFELGNFSSNDFKVHESNTDFIKMTAMRKIKLSSWIKVKESSLTTMMTMTKKTKLMN
jgi:hypothetical protein